MSRPASPELAEGRPHPNPLPKGEGIKGQKARRCCAAPVCRYGASLAVLLAVPVLLILALACAQAPTPTLPLIIVPPPTATPVPATDVSTSGPTDTEAAETAAAPTPTDIPGYPAPTTPLSADHLTHLPDDPTELMYATFDQPMLQVGQKMAYSHNDAFIPVLLEFMRFQQNEEAQLTLASFMVRIRDRIPEGEFAIVPYGQDSWGWWVEWLASHPEVTAPDGYDGWKGQLFGIIDEPMGAFMYPGVPTTIRLEEIVWGGVRRDGIPDLRFPPHVAPEDAAYLDSGDRVFGVSINGEHRAYPLRVLNPHEMANDVLGGVQFALAY